MSRVRVHNFSVSLDGFATGEGQTLEEPFGHAGGRLHEWFFETRIFRAMQGKTGGAAGADDALARTWNEGVGAEIMGRNKFGPQRGPWEDHEWTGWWGPNPPFHTPVFVMTHHPRPSVEMEGGTTFHFIDATPEEVLRQARRPRAVSTCGSAAGRASSVSSSPRTWSTTCTSPSSRSSSAAANDCGTGSKGLSSASTSSP